MKTPPRLRILVLGDGQDTPPISRFVANLADRGHHIVPTRSVQAASEADLIVLSPAAGELMTLVNNVAPMVRPRHIVIHTYPHSGLGVLEHLHHRGAIIGRLSYLAEAVWCVEGGDELAETILELLVFESGGKVSQIESELESPEARFLCALRHQSDNDLRRIYQCFYPNEGLAPSSESSDATPKPAQGLGQLPDLPVIKQLYQRLAEQEDPSFLRYVLFLLRRAAEEQSHHEVEMWVLAEEAKINH
ncbi:hypothetical protein GP475_10680 [Corynebacterium poyangense]|uniref:Putative oxidoreductase/dehydrogenase Rossmann-like domain-containing protein n=1 Tax=Corynebacterium poyangense TaxID=2684405 RepID=A0A7H0SR67_9CORY|nr:hypothetical protein [Corynebacterium poyangense]MBZ8176470.1 hypothetical protein [Corynebacterium poyangense]QNQ91042.1 hypothetical protein GP475_10680 [Corynebacterium poyangense]